MSLFRSASLSLRASTSRHTAGPVLLYQSTATQRSLLHTSAARFALSADARKKIDHAINANPLVVFMKGTPDMPMCGFSRAVIQILEVQGVDKNKLKTYNCLDDQELREGIKEYSAWPTIPQVYVKGEFTGGCDIMLDMHKSGELEKLLQDSQLLTPESQPSAKKVHA